MKLEILLIVDLVNSGKKLVEKSVLIDPGI